MTEERLAGSDGEVSSDPLVFRVSRELVEKAREWSGLVRFKFEDAENGGVEMVLLSVEETLSFDVSLAHVRRGNLRFEWRDYGQTPKVLVEVNGEVVADLSMGVFNDGVTFESGVPGCWTVKFAPDLREVSKGGTPWCRTTGGKDRL